ncbi:valine--pyruvate aminotransferase [Marinagarivorans cellulosilyticus]|uniref:Valine--pyruvate aminotransferase n=2 Tax=Marinagarivorans cellulosilyticus TaxID=2721545 RepID=A0AAN1WJZ6_9GAMM|nr:valine--pyruvate aminotransferase [Marinagarivorans cellulosilyticus]
MAAPSAIAELMRDLGEALNTNPDLLFLGGGNPALIPEAGDIFSRHLQALLNDKALVQRWLGVYQSPQGSESLLPLLSQYLQDQGWPVSAKNLVVVNGGQSAFNRLFNLLGGPSVKGTQRIHLPMLPEYVGYRGQMIGGDAFAVSRPIIALESEHRFRYKLDRSALVLDEHSGALCLSRPTNPSANVVDLEDVRWLEGEAKRWGIPMLVDCAYGAPFPNIMAPSQAYRWRPGSVAVLSASKLGLPGLRTAVVVADEELASLLAHVGAVENLASGNTGPLLLESLIASGDIHRLTQLIPEYYQPKRKLMLALLDEHLQDVPYRIHGADGAFFVWLWLPNLPVSAKVLYQRLKARNVLVMAGNDFFFGEEASWQHARECLRLNICQSDQAMAEAVAIIASEIKALYSKAK